MFSCEYCEIFKKNFFPRTPPVAASGLYRYVVKLLLRRPLVIFFALTYPSKRLREAAVRRCFSKKLYLKIFANLAGNTCVGVSFKYRMILNI